MVHMAMTHLSLIHFYLLSPTFASGELGALRLDLRPTSRV
uniref:Uncharacterized protein n=1 Tax=Arundo donax TaxID=35708 RepID=A0A0A9ALW0_ARUDO